MNPHMCVVGDNIQIKRSFVQFVLLDSTDSICPSTTTSSSEASFHLKTPPIFGQYSLDSSPMTDLQNLFCGKGIKRSYDCFCTGILAPDLEEEFQNRRIKKSVLIKKQYRFL